MSNTKNTPTSEANQETAWELDVDAWKIVTRRSNPHYCDQTVLRLPEPLDDSDRAPILADARMASAAKEMFAALQAFAGVEDFGGWHAKYGDAIQLARAAMAKAKSTT